MTDMACQFGTGDRLKGIISSPQGGRYPALGIVLVSAGFTAKTGPYRVYAELARSLAALGSTVLRFDLGGIGDSQILHPNQPLEVRTNDDIRDAIDYLQSSFGSRKFVVGGLCSGAEDAFRYAENDARVDGVVLIDPHAYLTWTWWIRNVCSRHCFNRVVCKLLRMLGFVENVSDSDQPSSIEGFEGELIDYKYMEKDESSRILRHLVQRTTNLHYIYTGGRTEKFNHKAQFRRMFDGIDLANCLTLDYLPHIGHVQVFAEDRDELVATICDRIDDAYLRGPTASG